MTSTWCVLAAAVGIGCVACGTSRPAEQTAAHVTVAAPTASALPSVTAVPSARPGPPGKVPIRETTPGKIQCETVDCDLATEVCCVAPGADGGSVGHCAAKTAVVREGASPCCPKDSGAFCGNDTRTLERRCDEALDCAAGQGCCAWSAWEGDLGYERCDSPCSAEKCLSGSTCGNGNLCAAEDGAPGGECPLQIKPPKCGATTCKTGELCCWDRDRSTSRCAESCDAEADAVFACTSPDQCAPHECHSYSGMNPPKYSCGGEGFFGSILCQTIKDCPQQLNSLGSGPGAPTLKGCVHGRHLPAAVKECDYK